MRRRCRPWRTAGTAWTWISSANAIWCMAHSCSRYAAATVLLPAPAQLVRPMMEALLVLIAAPGPCNAGAAAPGGPAAGRPAARPAVRSRGAGVKLRQPGVEPAACISAACFRQGSRRPRPSPLGLPGTGCTTASGRRAERCDGVAATCLFIARSQTTCQVQRRHGWRQRCPQSSPAPCRTPCPSASSAVASQSARRAQIRPAW